ncbi:MAG TPA: TonB-dependent receptor [Flavitalea sp.]|nr:TonB-dependent receptor [Flavitalea sp.]
MKTLLFLSCLCFSTVFCFGQAVISGKVKDQKGRPVTGASIAIKDSYDGATSDSLGNYRFTTNEKGDKILIITSIGYKPLELPVSLQGSAVKVDLQLKEEPNELTAVVITAGTFEASDTKRTTVLNPIDIVTTASANADVTAAVKTLPGAQQIGESEGLFVRGGTAQETKVFIDGTLVNNFFYSSVPDIAQRGRFSPFIFKGTVFSSGGYSALYGQALSSALILESVDLPDQSSANIGFSTVGINLGYQQLAKKKNASWGIGYSYANLAAYFAIVKQKPDNFKIPSFHNGEFNFRIKTSKTGILKYYGYFNYSTLGLRRPDIDSVFLKDAFALTNFNLYHNLSWKEKLGSGWRLNTGISYSTNTDKIDNDLVDRNNQQQFIAYAPYSGKNFNVNAKSDLSQIRAVLEKKLPGLSMFRFGGEYQYFRDRSVFGSPTISDYETVTSDHLKAAFAETDIYLTNDLAAKIGGRFEHSSIMKKSNLVPRLSLAYKIGKGQASVAYGDFYQKPDKDFYLRGYSINNLNYTKATHYIVNYQQVSRDYTFRLEGFYKKYKDLIKTYARNGFSFTDSAATSGYGDAKGIELFWRDRKTLKNVDYWISYSWLDTKRDYLNYPMALKPNFAATHTANLVVKKFVTKMKTQFNASYTYATGRPYYNFRFDQGDGKFKIADQGTTIDYHSMSFSVNYLPSIGKPNAKKFTVVVFSVNNVLGSNQVFGYNYSYNGLRKEPIEPAAKRFFFLGCFISFGVDNTDDVINNNL